MNSRFLGRVAGAPSALLWRSLTVQSFNNLRRIRSIALAVSLLSTSSCAEHCGDFKYFDFSATPGISAGETRVPPLNGLERVNAFPIQYIVQRSTYRLLINANEKAYGPEATLSVESFGAPLAVRLVSVPKAPDGSSCVSKEETKGSLKISWLDWRNCASSQVVGVEIIDQKGGRIASEELVVGVTVNGRYCVEE